MLNSRSLREWICFDRKIFDIIGVSFSKMEPTEAQLRRLYELIQINWLQSGLLYDFGLDPDSIFFGCYLAVFGTPIDNSNWELTKAYYIYQDGSALDEDDIQKRR
jgi:hypothetical protein